MSLATVRTFQDNGPFFPPTKGCYQAASISDVLRHCKLAMADGEHVIGLFDAEGTCKGIWENCPEPESDGGDGWCFPARVYDLLRPNGYRPKHFSSLVELLK
jgi:hypothetical protein